MEFLKTLAPLLGTALAGPFGGIAASFIADKLGVPDKTVEAVTSLLSAGGMTPEQLSGIKLAEIDFQKFMMDNDIKKEQLALDNTRGARDMRVATKSIFPEILSCGVVLGFFGILIMMSMNHDLADSAPMMIMLGSLSAAFGAVMNFWLGSNQGSDRTKELLAHATVTRTNRG
jgi:hypothetical protein